MTQKQLLETLPMMLVAFIATPLAFIFIMVDIITRYIFEGKFEYQTNLYTGFGNFLARVLRQD